MSPDWLQISRIASFVGACVLGLLLWLHRQAEKTFSRIDREIEAERAASYAEHVPCPWTLKP